MKALQHIVAPALLSVGLAFAANAQDVSQEDKIENAIEMAECTGDVLGTLMHEAIDGAIESVRQGVALTPEQEAELGSGLEARAFEAIETCAASATNIPADQIPSIDSPEFETFLNENVSLQDFSIELQFQLMEISMEIMPKMLELEGLLLENN